jgi:hypothetical protein
MGAPPLQALLPPRPRWLVRRLDVHHHHHPCVGLLFVLQTRTSSSRTQRSSLTTLVYCIDTLQAVVVAFTMERNMSVWAIGFDMNLLVAAYSTR